MRHTVTTEAMWAAADILRCGDVRERPKRHDWKSCDPRGSKGSNPFVSAIGFGAKRGTRACFCRKARAITLVPAVLGGGLGVP